MTNYVFCYVLERLIESIRSSGWHFPPNLPLQAILWRGDVYLSTVFIKCDETDRITSLIQRDELLLYRGKTNLRNGRWRDFPERTRFKLKITKKGLNLVKRKIKEFQKAEKPEIVAGVLNGDPLISDIVELMTRDVEEIEKIKKGEIKDTFFNCFVEDL